MPRVGVLNNIDKTRLISIINYSQEKDGWIQPTANGPCFLILRVGFCVFNGDGTMNIIKGIDRIALVLAIAAVIPGILFGIALSYDTFKTISPENEAKYQEEYQKWSQSEGIGKRMNIPMRQYTAPPVWQYLVGATIGGFISFAFVLYFIRGLTRGIRWLALWIIDGFKGNRDKYRK